MILPFDSRGNLEGNSPIIIDLDTFKANFVYNEKRELLFRKYQNYIIQLKKVTENAHFYQWINGSYVTKLANPKDIDMVTFIDFELYQKLTNSDISFKETLSSPYTKQQFDLDCYFEETYPSNHKEYQNFQSNQLYWHHLFIKTNPKHDRNKKTFPKAFIQINY
jgi:hypothetical protein